MGVKEDVVMPSCNLLTFLPPVVQDVSRDSGLQQISYEEVRFQSLHLAETSKHKVGTREITKKCLLIITFSS